MKNIVFGIEHEVWSGLVKGDELLTQLVRMKDGYYGGADTMMRKLLLKRVEMKKMNRRKTLVEMMRIAFTRYALCSLSFVLLNVSARDARSHSVYIRNIRNIRRPPARTAFDIEAAVAICASQGPAAGLAYVDRTLAC